MNGPGMMWVVLTIAAVGLLVTMGFRTARVVPATPEMSRALSRMNITTAAAATAGIGFALLAWGTFPTTLVGVTKVPGLLAALGPSLAGLVYLAIFIVAEATWRRPTGDARAANLTRRPLFVQAQPWAERALLAWSLLLAGCVIAFGVIAAPGGRQLAYVSWDCSVDGVPVACDGLNGPFPGWPYGVPILFGAAAVLTACFTALYLIARRPAIRGVTNTDDEAMRVVSATRVVRGAQLSLGTTLTGITFIAGAAAANADLWWGLPAIIFAGIVLLASLVISMLRTVITTRTEPTPRTQSLPGTAQ